MWIVMEKRKTELQNSKGSKYKQKEFPKQGKQASKIQMGSSSELKDAPYLKDLSIPKKESHSKPHCETENTDHVKFMIFLPTVMSCHGRQLPQNPGRQKTKELCL